MKYRAITPQPHTRRMRTIVERLVGNPGYSNFNRRFTTKLSTRSRLQNRTQDYRKIDNTDKGRQGGTRSLSFESGQRDEESRFRVQVLGGRKERERGATKQGAKGPKRTLRRGLWLHGQHTADKINLTEKEEERRKGGSRREGGERGNPDQRRRTGEVGRREDLGSGKRMH